MAHNRAYGTTSTSRQVYQFCKQTVMVGLLPCGISPSELGIRALATDIVDSTAVSGGVELLLCYQTAETRTRARIDRQKA